MPERMRRVAALVLGVLAVLGTLVTLIAGSAGVVGTQARSAASAGTTSGPVSNSAVHLPATRARGDHPLTAPRSVRATAATAAARCLRAHGIAAASRAAGHLRHWLPGVAALPAALVAATLAVAGLVLAGGEGRASRRTSMANRGRAPPASALA